MLPYHVVSCCIMPYTVGSCRICCILPLPALSAVSCHFLPYPATSCRILPYPAVSCHLLPYPAVSCRILPYPAVSCRIEYTYQRNLNPTHPTPGDPDPTPQGSQTAHGPRCTRGNTRQAQGTAPHRQTAKPEQPPTPRGPRILYQSTNQRGPPPSPAAVRPAPHGEASTQPSTNHLTPSPPPPPTHTHVT